MRSTFRRTLAISILVGAALIGVIVWQTRGEATPAQQAIPTPRATQAIGPVPIGTPAPPIIVSSANVEVLSVFPKWHSETSTVTTPTEIHPIVTVEVNLVNATSEDGFFEILVIHNASSELCKTQREDVEAGQTKPVQVHIGAVGPCALLVSNAHAQLQGVVNARTTEYNLAVADAESQRGRGFPVAIPRRSEFDIPRASYEAVRAVIHESIRVVVLESE